jgi:hypothetical protein
VHGSKVFATNRYAKNEPFDLLFKEKNIEINENIETNKL